jgi:hypothetical protein
MQKLSKQIPELYIIHRRRKQIDLQCKTVYALQAVSTAGR